MGKIEGTGGIVRVLGVVLGMDGSHWIVERFSDKALFKFRVETITGGLDPRLGDKGEFVDVEGIESSLGDYIVRQVSVIEGLVDLEAIERLYSNM